MVLQLVAEAAYGQGQAGPYVYRDGNQILLRDWLCKQLLPLSEQQGRRAALRARGTVSLKDELTGEVAHDSWRIEQAVEEQVLAVGRANVSRAISDFARAGLLTRHYAGYATNHRNRGGGRHAIYVVRQEVLRLLRRPAHVHPRHRHRRLHLPNDRIQPYQAAQNHRSEPIRTEPSPTRASARGPTSPQRLKTRPPQRQSLPSRDR